MLNGIDVYEGDNISDWDLIKRNYDVVIQKATQGTGHTDRLLSYRYPKIKNAGLKIGFYHFAQYNSRNPIDEAQHFLNAIKGLESDTVLFLDIEIEDKWDKRIAINFANAFIKYVQSQGYSIGIYTGYYFYKDYLEGNILQVPLWIASYGKQPSTYPEDSWQYSENGRILGAIGYVDLNYFNENILNGGTKRVKNIVCINNSVDERAAGYLADFLQCPIIDNALVKFDYSVVENVYCVGGGQFTDHAKQIIKGQTRYDTCQAVLDFIKNGGK